jgi:hypothetical protein
MVAVVLLLQLMTHAVLSARPAQPNALLGDALGHGHSPCCLWETSCTAVTTTCEQKQTYSSLKIVADLSVPGCLNEW